MSYACLGDFLEELGRRGELVRVATAVEAVLEAAEVSRQAARRTGNAFLFTSTRGYNIPCATEILATERRICLALGVATLDETAAKIEALLDPGEPEGWFERLKTVPTRNLLGRLPPRLVKTGRCQQVVLLGGDVDLARLPVLQSWPEESGRTITAGQCFMADARSGRRFVGRYDLTVLDANRLAVHWAAHEPPARLLEEYARRREPMPVAIVLGGDPAGLLAAMAPLPASVDACAVAGLLRDRPVELVACRSVALHVPAEAEIVIEGTIEPGEPPVTSGLLSTPLGHYAAAGPAPVIHVTALTHRPNPVFPAMVHGPPPNEFTAISRAMQRVFLPMTRLGIPELVDCNLPDHGGARQIAFASIRKTHAGQAHRVAQALWGLPWITFAKLLVIVDEDVDVHDAARVWAAVASNMDPGRDVLVEQGPPDPWDPATPPGALGRRLGIDATTKLPGESAARSRPVVMSDEIHQLVRGRWAQYVGENDQ